jgi:hypothetical protein
VFSSVSANITVAIFRVNVYSGGRKPYIDKDTGHKWDVKDVLDGQPLRWRQYIPLKRYTAKRLQGKTIQETLIYTVLINTTVKHHRILLIEHPMYISYRVSSKTVKGDPEWYVVKDLEGDGFS